MLCQSASADWSTWEPAYINSTGYAYKFNGIERVEAFQSDFAFYRGLDPILGRWYQVDPRAEMLYGLSPYNSMANNPIVYADPEGDFIHIVVGAAIGGVINLGVQAYKGNIRSFGDGLAAFGIGAVAGGVGAATGGATFAAVGFGGAAGGAIAGGAGGLTGGFINGTGNTLYFGDASLVEALGQGLIEGAVGLGTGAILGGGIGALTTPKGYSPWTGKPIASPTAGNTVTITVNGQTIEVPGYTAEFPKYGDFDGLGGGNVYSSTTSGTTRLPASYYPPNGGALGNWTTSTLRVGQVIDRYGSLNGKYFSPQSTPLQVRALPPGAENLQYTKFEVLKPFSVQQSTVAPAFNQWGGGLQYHSKFLTANELIQGGYIRVIR